MPLPPDVPTREVLWNISNIWVMYAMLVPTLAIAAYGVYRRWQRWQLGEGKLRFDQPARRLRRVFDMAIAQKPIWRRKLSGVFHSLLFWGFVTLFIATSVVAVHHDFGHFIPALQIMQGNFYLFFQSFFVDVMGALALVGVCIAGSRRWFTKPKQLVFSDQADWILIAIISILFTGFLLEGWRIEVTDDPWAAYSPIGLLFGKACASFMSTQAMQSAHLLFWWSHMAMVFGLIAWAPYTKLIHPLTSTLNIFTADLDGPLAKLKNIDFEKAEVFGINSLAQFTQKDLLDLDACTECGRCTSVCPANTVGKELSPRDIILALQNQLSLASQNGVDASEGLRDDDDNIRHPIIGSEDALSTDALFQCTTCGGCVDICPVSIQQFPKIIDMRRYMVMEEADFPEGMQNAITSLEQRGHPFRGSQASRTDWADGLEIPHYSDVSDPEVLLWVGCGGSLVDRNQKTTRALAQLLTHAGVKFGILGKDESCTGDPARRIGNEFLFDTLARETVESINSQEPKTIVTSCPHCFNSFMNEYPDLGGNWEVLHHTMFLAKLIGENRLSVDQADLGKATLHDPCYLGRHNGVTDDPRDLLKRVAGESNTVEMPRHGRDSFCCGGGGGMAFVDEPVDKRVNRERAEEAVATGANVVAVGCPFCTTMLEDGINAVKGERDVVVKDIAELMWESVDKGNGKPV